MPNKKGAGRPSIDFDLSKLDELEECAYMGMSQEHIADYFGMCNTRFKEILRTERKINVYYKRGRAKALRNTGSKLREQIDKGNVPSIIFHLKTQGGWRETDNINVSSEDGSLIANEKIYVEFIKNKKKKEDDECVN